MSVLQGSTPTISNKSFHAAQVRHLLLILEIVTLKKGYWNIEVQEQAAFRYYNLMFSCLLALFYIIRIKKFVLQLKCKSKKSFLLGKTFTFLFVKKMKFKFISLLLWRKKLKMRYLASDMINMLFI